MKHIITILLFTLLPVLVAGQNDLTGDKDAFKGAMLVADHLLTQVGSGKADIVQTGNYRGMPDGLVLKPIVLLYRRTSGTKYLNLAQYIVGQWETENGPDFCSSCLGKRGWKTVSKVHWRPGSEWECSTLSYNVTSVYGRTSFREASF